MTTAILPDNKVHQHNGQAAQTINLYELGMLFVVRCCYWGCRVRNNAEDLELTADQLDRKAVASLGTRNLLAPDKTRKLFQHIEKKARHALEKLSRPFAAANAHFVPWNQVQSLIEQLEAIKAEFDCATREFLNTYPTLRDEWVAEHPGLSASQYPSVTELADRFSLSWHAFKVTGAPELASVTDVESELEQRSARRRQVELMEATLRRECEEFVEQYVLGFRREVADFCDQVIAQQGKVHGRTLQAIRRRIDQFHCMNVFGDADAASKLTSLKHQIAGLTGQDLAQQPDVASKLNRACQTLKNQILDPDAVSSLTGRLRRRVVLD